jgi:uncharacterized protein YcfJ
MMLVLAGTSLGGWIGWALGDRFGLMAAFMLSLVGTAAGLYFANRIARNYLP